MHGETEIKNQAKNMLGFGFESGKVFQLGFLVENIDKAMAFYNDSGIAGAFTCHRGFTAPDGDYRGSRDCPALSIAHAFSGNIYIELIEQHDNTPSVYTEYMEKYGWGLHHVGIAVAPGEYDSVLDSYYAKGFENVFTDRLPTGARIRYIAPKGEAAREQLRKEAGVCYFEFVEAVQGEDEFFAAIRTAAGA